MDSLHASLAALADAADALAKAAATLELAAQAIVEAVEALSGEVSRPESPEESHGINLGRGSDAGFDTMPNEADRDEEQPVSAVMADTEDQAELHTSNTNLPQHPRNAYGIDPPYRLLVDSEADVLLFVCAIIDERQKIICYVPCGNVPLKAYKHLFESVTGSPVHMLSSISKWDLGYTDFLKSHDSVLLVPETLSPQLELEENSWVIHVGWPASEERYTTQRMTHRAHNNLLVACSRDQSLYSSGDSIMEQTKPWPRDGAPFRASVTILRPLYEIALSEISLEVKAQVYRDWIQLHGVHGSRRVEAWSPSAVVQHANDYLVQVWQWSGKHTEGDNILLPEVSRGFVTQNSLQQAVLEGLLRVEDNDSESVTSLPPLPRPDSVPIQTEFQPTVGNTCFIIEEEFDAIPLICFISENYGKVILFLEGQGALRYYQKLITKITGRLTIFPTALNDSHAIEEAVVKFLAAPPPAILLLAYNINNPPSALSQGSIDCCIYWTFNSPLKSARRNQSLINCETTIVIMMPIRQRRTSFAKDFSKHPSAAIIQDLTESSVLAPMRNKTRSILASSKGVVKSLYTNRVYGVGVIPRQSLSAEEVARRANQYAARVLLHGEREDGSEIFPPVTGRPLVPRTAVDKFDLQPAVDAGLLAVG
ncbi:hypothetical protein ACGC1H_002418 [Rhizoctonia solani]